MKKNLTKRDNISLIIPLILAISIIPLIIYAKYYLLDAQTASYWTGKTENIEFFTYYKALWLQILGTICLGIAIYYIVKNRKSVKSLPVYIVIPLGIYAILSVLSAFASKYPQIALYGYPERYEGLFVILFYIVLCLSAALLITSGKQLNYIFTFLFITASIIAIIGVFQTFNLDLFRSGFGKKLILPSSLYHLIDQLDFTFKDNIIYTTLQNPNYVGIYFAMIFNLTTALYFFNNKKSIKIALALLSFLFFYALLGSKSTAGFIGAFIGLFIILVFARKKIIKEWKFSVIPIVLIVGCLILANSMSDGYIYRAWIGKFLTQQSNSQSVTNNGSVTDFSSHDSDFLINVGPDTLIVRLDPEKGYLFLDQNNNQLSLSFIDSSHFTVNDNRFNKITFFVGSNRMQVIATNTQFIISYNEKGYFQFVNTMDTPIDLVTPPTYGFEGKELWGSSRGYIWSRSIPLIKNNILIGGGPDTFAMQFPQNEYNAKMKYLSNVYSVVDKPHNFYLQVAINSGLVSLIALLFAFAAYFVWSVKLYINPKSDNCFYYYGVACLATVCAFLVNSISTDSTVNASPVFWIVLGCGIACNKMYKKTII